MNKKEERMKLSNCFLTKSGMEHYDIEILGKVEKYLETIEEKFNSQIRSAIETKLHHTPTRHSKRLQGNYKVGDFRIIFIVSRRNLTVTVVEVI